MEKLILFVVTALGLLVSLSIGGFLLGLFTRALPDYGWHMLLGLTGIFIVIGVWSYLKKRAEDSN